MMNPPNPPEKHSETDETELPAGSGPASKRKTPAKPKTRTATPGSETLAEGAPREEKPPKGRTATPSNVPQTAGPDHPYRPSYDETARRAYELYLERGGEHGRHDEDWYRAEDELRQQRMGGASGGTPSADGAARSGRRKKVGKPA